MDSKFSTSKGKHSVFGKQLVRTAERHGFVSNWGIGKVSLKAAKKPFEAKAHPYHKKKPRKSGKYLHMP